MIRFTMDPASRIRVAEFSGRVNAEELLSSYSALIAAVDYDPTVDDLVDMRAVEHLELGADAVQRLVSLFIPLDGTAPPTRLAIVAPSDELFGMARMYQILRTDAPGEIEVFRDRVDADRWIGLLPVERRWRRDPL